LAALAARVQALLAELFGLMQAATAVTAVRANFGLDLRVSGALAALQARFAARASAQASAAAAAQASMQASMTGMLMARLGVAATAQGALSVNAMAQAMARLGAGLPALTVPAAPLSALSALKAILAAIRNALGVNLLAPQANLRASISTALGPLPL